MNLIISDYSNNKIGNTFKSYNLNSKNFFHLLSGNNYISLNVLPEKENILTRLIELGDGGNFNLGIIPTVVSGKNMRDAIYTFINNSNCRTDLERMDFMNAIIREQKIFVNVTKKQLL